MWYYKYTKIKMKSTGKKRKNKNKENAFKEYLKWVWLKKKRSLVTWNGYKHCFMVYRETFHQCYKAGIINEYKVQFCQNTWSLLVNSFNMISLGDFRYCLVDSKCVMHIQSECKQK